MRTRFKLRGALFVAALAASAVALPTASAPAWEQCYAVFSDGGDICVGSSTCEAAAQKVQKVTGDRPWECLQ